jgi:hypothetical protein
MIFGKGDQIRSALALFFFHNWVAGVSRLIVARQGRPRRLLSDARMIVHNSIIGVYHSMAPAKRWGRPAFLDLRVSLPRLPVVCLIASPTESQQWGREVGSSASE